MEPSPGTAFAAPPAQGVFQPGRGPSHTPPGAAGPPGTSGLVFLVLKQVERSHFLSQDRGEFLTGTSLPSLLAFQFGDHRQKPHGALLGPL